MNKHGMNVEQYIALNNLNAAEGLALYQIEQKAEKILTSNTSCKVNPFSIESKMRILGATPSKLYFGRDAIELILSKLSTFLDSLIDDGIDYKTGRVKISIIEQAEILESMLRSIFAKYTDMKKIHFIYVDYMSNNIKIIIDRIKSYISDEAIDRALKSYNRKYIRELRSILAFMMSEDIPTYTYYQKHKKEFSKIKSLTKIIYGNYPFYIKYKEKLNEIDDMYGSSIRNNILKEMDNSKEKDNVTTRQYDMLYAGNTEIVIYDRKNPPSFDLVLYSYINMNVSFYDFFNYAYLPVKDEEIKRKFSVKNRTITGGLENSIIKINYIEALRNIKLDTKEIILDFSEKEKEEYYEYIDSLKRFDKFYPFYFDKDSMALFRQSETGNISGISEDTISEYNFSEKDIEDLQEIVEEQDNIKPRKYRPITFVAYRYQKRIESVLNKQVELSFREIVSLIVLFNSSKLNGLRVEDKFSLNHFLVIKKWSSKHLEAILDLLKDYYINIENLTLKEKIWLDTVTRHINRKINNVLQTRFFAKTYSVYSEEERERAMEILNRDYKLVNEYMDFTETIRKEIIDEDVKKAFTNTLSTQAQIADATSKEVAIACDIARPVYSKMMRAKRLYTTIIKFTDIANYLGIYILELMPEELLSDIDKEIMLEIKKVVND